MPLIDSPSDERLARMRLAAVSDPYDLVTGQLIGEIGAVATIRLLQDPSAAHPESVHPEQVHPWREFLAPHLAQTSAQGLLISTHEHALDVLIPGDADWPAGLDDLGHAAPYALWTKGDTTLLAAPQHSRVTIDGARSATTSGMQAATGLAGDLAEQGHVLVSAGLYGIDSAVHRTAIASDSGSTIAVMAGGLDRYFPTGNEDLLRSLEARGLLLSEYPPGRSPNRERVIHRPRLLAALSEFTVIVEAGVKSGSLRVAEQAYELGRWVGAVPGSVTSAASIGTNRLLRDGIAEVILDATDVTAITLPSPTASALSREYQDVARTLDAPALHPSRREL